MEQLSYSPAHAAQVLDISRSKVYAYLADGTIPSAKIGRSRRISREHLLAFLEQHTDVAAREVAS